MKSYLFKRMLTYYGILFGYWGVTVTEQASPEKSETSRDEDVLQRFKRSTPSCLDRYKAISGHTACLEKSPKASESGVGKADQTLILEKHNRLRSEIKDALNMLKMSWDEDAAMIAQKWADNCAMKHDDGAKRVIPGRFGLGQNIVMGATSWTQAFAQWEAEKKKFTYGAKNVFTEVGHYTQIIWATTSKVGCGYAKCGDRAFYVCNYGPPGNVGGVNQPYEKGTPCSTCKTCDATTKLCNCSVTCENGGTLDLASCSCKCKHPFHVESSCRLDCSKAASDPHMCSTQYGDNPCSVIANDCPNKCRACPFAGINYKEGTADYGGCNVPTVNILLFVLAVTTLVHHL